MNTNEEAEDIVKMREEIVKQCLAGKPLFGKDGALAPMIQSILNAVLEGEMDAHLTEEERQSGNRRNGKMEKQVQTSLSNWGLISQQLAIKFGDRFPLM